MSNLINKMSFDDTVRYLFTGLSMCAGYLLAKGKSPSSWFDENTWASKAFPGAFGVAVVIFAGYLVFQVYRSLVYPNFIIPVRSWLWLSPKFKYIRPLAKAKGIPISPIRTEDIYGALIREDLKEKYPKKFSAIATSIHMMYCSGIILLSFSICGCNKFWIITSIVLLIAALFNDFRYESMEVNIFKREDKIVDEALESLKERTNLKKS